MTMTPLPVAIQKPSSVDALRDRLDPRAQLATECRLNAEAFRRLAAALPAHTAAAPGRSQEIDLDARSADVERALSAVQEELLAAKVRAAASEPNSKRAMRLQSAIDHVTNAHRALSESRDPLADEADLALDDAAAYGPGDHCLPEDALSARRFGTEGPIQPKVVPIFDRITMRLASCDAMLGRLATRVQAQERSEVPRLSDSVVVPIFDPVTMACAEALARASRLESLGGGPAPQLPSRDSCSRSHDAGGSPIAGG